MIRGASLRGFTRLVEELGGDPVELARRFAIPLRALVSDDELVPITGHDAMLDAAADSRAPRAKIEQRRYRVEGTSAALLAELVASRVVASLGPMRGLISRGSPYWWAVGYTDDLARVEMYVPHIVHQARAGWKTHLRSYYANELDRVAFFDAFGWAVRGRLEKMFREEVPEPASGGGAALVIANRADAVDEFVNVPTARPRRAFGHTGATAGYEAGMAADLSAGALEGAGVTGS